MNTYLNKIVQLLLLKMDTLCNLTQNLSLKDKDDKEKNFQLYPLKNHKYFPHQIQTGKWMKEQERDHPNGFKGGIISLTMGLGKTLLVLGYSLAHNKPTLIVVPKSILFEWKINVDKFFAQDNNVKVLYFHRDINNQVDTLTREDIVNHNIIITTYGVCSRACLLGEYHKPRRERRSKLIYQDRGYALLYNLAWDRIIFDESHKCCNPKTKTFHYLMTLKGRNNWCMSGTPIINYKTDIWSQLRLCGYTEVDTPKEWKAKGQKLFSTSLKSSVYSLQYVDVGIRLPTLEQKKIIIELDDKQQELYDLILFDVRKEYNRIITLDKSYSCILVLLMRLRQAAIAPYIISSEAKRQAVQSATYNLDKQLHGMQAAKIQKTISLVHTIKQQQDQNTKIIIYSMFVTALDLLYEAIRKYLPALQIVQIDGETKNRNEILDKFKNCNIDCMLTSYKVAAEGLTITQANHCIFLEPWWNSATLNQARSRLWRVGQTRPVTVYNLISENTIEERLLEICDNKDIMVDSYLNANKGSEINCKLSKAVLHKLINKN